MAIAPSLDAEPGTGFGALGELGLTVCDAVGETRLRYEVDDAGPVRHHRPRRARPRR
ncbi:hypothetical protein [Micromonospora sp. KC213]|uniref:hypothetical protein n=1 Tax=Micromonospora sp. KC213 TaxID=2530378 RepID=UPI0014046FFA|nr:hypothetical protein [Micromonospora sp. KC213]